jgi:16S rRNA (cytidine1402-2'-O)-methyltransferase
VGREITKLHEEFLRGTLGELAEAASKRRLRGEITVVLGPAKGPLKNAVEGRPQSRGEIASSENAPRASRFSLSQRIAQLMVDEGLDHKAALKKAGRERGLAKREAYRQLLLER